MYEESFQSHETNIYIVTFTRTKNTSYPSTKSVLEFLWIFLLFVLIFQNFSNLFWSWITSHWSFSFGFNFIPFFLNLFYHREDNDTRSSKQCFSISMRNFNFVVSSQKKQIPCFQKWTTFLVNAMDCIVEPCRFSVFFLSNHVYDHFESLDYRFNIKW